MNESTVFFAHFEHEKSKSHRMRLNNEPKTAKDFYDWITIQRIEVEEKFGSCIIANCGIIR